MDFAVEIQKRQSETKKQVKVEKSILSRERNLVKGLVERMLGVREFQRVGHT